MLFFLIESESGKRLVRKKIALGMRNHDNFLGLKLAPLTIDETWRAEGEVEEPAIGARRRAKQETHRAVESLWEPCRTASW
ncbi:MAG: hypothetical protein ACREXS_01215, partial [Gammaproteobacteria bacterium]